jgi:hypothetical protein
VEVILGYEGQGNRGMEKTAYITRRLMISTLTKYYLGDQIKKNEMEGVLALTVERRGAYRILVGKPDGKSQLGRCRRGREGHNKMDV